VGSRLVSGTAWMLIAVAVVAFAVAAAMGWVEFFVLTATAIAAIGAAVPFVVGGGGLELERELPAGRRVTVGDDAIIALTARNPTSKSIAATVIDEPVAGDSRSIEIGRLDAGSEVPLPYPLPTERRAVVQLGPSTVARSDPFGLLRRSVGTLGIDRVWVHPRYRIVKELPVGFAKDLEGQTFDNSPAGDIAFHTIREYAPGDDIRHVHWMSTARSADGTIMVRHYVDNRRPALCVVVDPGLVSADADLFERAVEVVATLGVSGIRRDVRPSTFIGDRQVLEESSKQQPEAFLDELAGYVPQQDVTSEAAVAHALHASPNTSVLVYVTGAQTVSSVRSVSDRFRRRKRMLIVNLIAEDEPIKIPRVPTLNVKGLAGFVTAWNALS